MANSACGGMQTLGVAMEQIGKTNQVIAQTFGEVEALKPRFTQSEPDVKVNPPCVTELTDLPIC